MSGTALERARQDFQEHFGGAADVVVRAPGRVNLIGEHTDYNQGLVLPVAIDLDLVIAARATKHNRLHLVSAEQRDSVEFTIGERPRQRWARYIAGVAALLIDEAGVHTGAELLITSDIPAGSGLSSSAALEVATARALLALTERELPVQQIARIARRAELEYAGVNCGIMDQMIVLMAQAGHALLLDCATLDTRQVALPDHAALFIVESGANRELAASAYNQRVAECTEAARLLGVRNLSEIDAASVKRARLPKPLCQRARHVTSENERTHEFANALEQRDLQSCGALMNASQVSLREDYQVSSPALDQLVAAALEIPGVYGAKLTGAGFGGMVVVLSEAAQAVAVEDALRARAPVRRVVAAGGASRSDHFAD